MGNDCGYDSMGDFDRESIKLEKFYVYKSLHSDNSWGTVVFGADVSKLPNVSFGMKVFAKNEIEAIGKAKEVHDRIHGLDIEKENVRKFTSAALKSLLCGEGEIPTPDQAAEMAIQYAIATNDRYAKHFSTLEEKREVNPSPLSEEELEPLDE